MESHSKPPLAVKERAGLAAPAAVKAGLSKAIAISKGCAGVFGTAVNPVTGGLVPAKVICQLKSAGKV